MARLTTMSNLLWNLIRPGILVLILLLQSLCSASDDSSVNQEIIPWCVVTFDAEKRSPVERVVMLKEMGFTQYGYELRTGYPLNLQEEIELAGEHGLEISSVFLWLNAKRDSLEKLSPVNERIFDILKISGTKPDIWLSFSNNFFEDLDQEQSLKLASEFVSFVAQKAEETGCKVLLYNHQGWFGNPYNQVEIIESLSEVSLEMVYNFHHAHDYLNEFPEIVQKIKPYLSHVNINGMKDGGPQILTVGDGDREYEMMKALLDAGYDGPWGILGHIESEDVRVVLERNINGLEKLRAID